MKHCFVTKKLGILTFLYEKVTDHYFSFEKSYKSLFFLQIVTFLRKKGYESLQFRTAAAVMMVVVISDVLELR